MMSSYTREIVRKTVYSIGDVHGQGARVLQFVERLHTLEEGAFVVQLGDLGDAFSYPGDDAELPLERLREDVRARMGRIPELAAAMTDDRPLVDWQFDGFRDGVPYGGKMIGIRTPIQMLASEVREEVEAVFQATRVFETFKRMSEYQQAHADCFEIVFGNHDADLLRGESRYGRPQKHILLGLLGFSPDEVNRHLDGGGTPERLLEHPWLRWLSERPHLVMTPDVLYMHGGPTKVLAQKLADSHESFVQWVAVLDEARREGLRHPEFEEHHCFLSPDGADNDWMSPSGQDIVRSFLTAARRQFLAVGHSPFLDFEKGPLIDLRHVSDEVREKFRTPAILPPDGRLIKHDTNMKRVGRLWALRHEVGSLLWSSLDEDLASHDVRRVEGADRP